MQNSTPLIDTLKLLSEPLELSGPALLLVTNGAVTVRGEDEEYVRLGRGDLLTVTPGGRCRVGGPREEAETVRFAADPGWTARALGLARCGPLRGPVPFFVDRVGTDPARRGGRLLHDPLDPGEGPATLGELKRAARHLELLALTCEARPSILHEGGRRGPARSESRRERLLAVLAGLPDGSLEGVTLQAIAEQIGISERQASRLFRAELGVTFREHLSRLRLERAKALLRETELPVIEVAAETGWSSLAHFNATFRERVGLTPTGYRASAWPAEGSEAA